MIQQTKPDTAVDPDVTINLRNRVAKSENQKSMRYRRATVSSQEQHQLHKSQHRHDPHGEESPMVCSFDLKCH
jgi:hypothetical protein